MAAHSQIILMTPQERVKNALLHTALAGLQLTAMGLLYTASPAALLAGSLGMLYACTRLRRRLNQEDARHRAAAFMTAHEGRFAQEQMLLDHLAHTAGIPAPALAAGEESLSAWHPRVLAYAARFRRDTYVTMTPQLQALPHVATWGLMHEFAHVARNDIGATPHINAFAAAGLMAGALAGDLAGMALGGSTLLLAPAFAGALLCTASAMLPTVTQLHEARTGQKASTPPLHELEAERVACDLLDAGVSFAQYAGGAGLAQHYRSMELPVPPFLRGHATTPPSPLQRGFNRLCRLICKPRTMPRFMPALNTRYGRTISLLRVTP